MEACSRTLEFRIPADKRYISLVRRGIRSLAESAGFGREDVADVEIAVSEAVTNSVMHGSRDVDSAAVVVKCHAYNDTLIVEIEDQSRAEALPPPPSDCDPCEETGRGVLMMYRLMDECVNCRTESGIRVRMAKQKAR
jgi:anti-sigma regulatory factor (Ser/Thr protein kinase)